MNESINKTYTYDVYIAIYVYKKKLDKLYL